MTPLDYVQVGLRLALAVNWTLIIVRVLFYHRQVPQQEPEYRAAAWRWYGAGLVILGLAIVGFYNIGGILFVTDVIGVEQRQLWNISGGVLNCIASACILRAFDASYGRNFVVSIPYFVMGLFAPLWIWFYGLV